MSLCRVNRNFTTKLLQKRCFSSALPDEDEYTAAPQYPPILDLSYLSRLDRKKETLRDKIKDVKTIEEKQIKLNMPKYYGFKTYMLEEDYVPYNNLNLVQHVTRTHLKVSNDLPEYFKKIEVDGLLGKIKSDIEEALLIELEGYRKIHEIKRDELSDVELENITSANLTRQINRILTNNLAGDLAHLLDVQVDEQPRVETSWYAGGMDPPENIKRLRKGKEWTKEHENLPTDRLMSYEGKSQLHVRSSLPLPWIISHSESDNPEFQVPFYEYDPRTVGTATTHKRMVNVPGFWPGDPNQFGIVSYHGRGHILTRKKYNDPTDDKEALHRQGILASFGWLNAQANFLGFNTFNDITYPLVTQTVITNGQTWSFYAYQLNTMLIHSHHVNDNPKRNICWAVPEMKLYETIENGKIIGLNDEVIKLLLKFYANKPEKRLGLNMTPYLRHEEKVIADYEDVEKRQWLEREYKFLVSDRPRYREIDELYAWEKIYKIDHKTRFMEKRLRFFELFKHPQSRTLDSRLPNYIPRKLRPELPRWKGRYAKEFWP